MFGFILGVFTTMFFVTRQRHRYGRHVFGPGCRSGWACDEHRPAATWASLLVGLVALWSLAGGLARSVMRPLTQLVEVARDLGDGKLGRRMDIGSEEERRANPEIGLLARCINDMAERLEQNADDQRELVAGVSHELRTPLGHLRILIDSARESPHGADRDQLFAELEREIVDIDGLTDRLLAHSRLEFERIEIHAIDVATLCIDALERTATDVTALELSTRRTTLHADPGLLARALANLLHNAREHGGGVERLWVREEADAGAHDGHGHKADPGLAFIVEDTGSGIDPEMHERIFSRFVRAEDRKMGQGTLGLGLSLVARIARAHGGRVWAENRLERGASIGFAIPWRARGQS